jgi:hypothetical protein
MRGVASTPLLKGLHWPGPRALEFRCLTGTFAIQYRSVVWSEAGAKAK